MCQRACHWRGFAEDGNLSRISTLIFAFLWTRRVLNYFLQKPFFPLYCHAACRLHLADNQPPARWLQHSLTPTRRKCMRTDSRGALGSLETTAGRWRSCRNTHEHGVGGYFTLKIYLCCCHVTHTDRDGACDLQVKRPIGRNSEVNAPTQYWPSPKEALIIFLWLFGRWGTRKWSIGLFQHLTSHEHQLINSVIFL